MSRAMRFTTLRLISHMRFDGQDKTHTEQQLEKFMQYDNVWEDQTYDFSISTLYSDTTLKSAELAETSGKKAPLTAKSLPARCKQGSH